jgi:hypothetical protein
VILYDSKFNSSIISTNIFGEIKMTVEDIYDIIISSTSKDFYSVNFDSDKLVYIYNPILTFESIHRDKRYCYEHFFDRHNQKVELNHFDQFVFDICQLDNHKSTYENIYLKTIAIKYNGNTIYTLEVLHICNPSTLDVYIPLDFDTEDYIINFINIWDEFYGENDTWKTKVLPRISKKITDFDIFIGRK